MQFFCVFFGSTFDAVDDDRSAGRPTVVLGGYDGSGGEADVAEAAQGYRPTAMLREAQARWYLVCLCKPVR